MTKTDDLIAQIERVLDKFPAIAKTWYSSNMVPGFQDPVAYAALRTECIALANYIYGERHPEAKAISVNIRNETLHHLQYTEGMLRGTIESLRHGLLSNLRTQVLLDIKTDFVEAAIHALDEGAVPVASVLAASVLEDSAKRLAEKAGLEASRKEFSEVVVALFKAEAITKATKGILLGYKDLRNSAMHAQWNHLSADAVRGLLTYLPQFMEQYGV